MPFDRRVKNENKGFDHVNVAVFQLEHSLLIHHVRTCVILSVCDDCLGFIVSTDRNDYQTLSRFLLFPFENYGFHRSFSSDGRREKHRWLLLLIFFTFSFCFVESSDVIGRRH